MREAVSIRATNLPGAKEPLTRESVLQALKTSEVELFPAPNRIPRPHRLIPTHQVPDVRARVLAARKGTVIHASGGVGKSALTYALADDLPRGSLAITYDCFGNGEYRRPSGPRHEARQAVIQIANELAGHGLCNPLLPGPTVTPSQYAWALVQRLNQAADALVADNPDALLLLCIDAADNAVLAAQEFNDTAFVTGLLREGLHPHVRLAVLCRSERRQLLDIPPEADQIELLPFNLDETRLHILALEDESGPAGEGHAAVLTKRDVETFYRVTGGYPRVQRAAFADAEDLRGRNSGPSDSQKIRRSPLGPTAQSR